MGYGSVKYSYNVTGLFSFSTYAHAVVSVYFENML